MQYVQYAAEARIIAAQQQQQQHENALLVIPRTYAVYTVTQKKQDTKL